AVEGDGEFLGDRVDEALGAAAEVGVVGGVDLGAAVRARDGHVEVAGDRQHLGPAALEVQHHDRVGPLAAGRVGAVEAGVALAGDVGPGVRPDDQVVGPVRGRGQRVVTSYTPFAD